MSTTGNSFSTYAANLVINALFRATNLTAPVTVYVALYTVAPTDAAGGTEVSGGSYARQPIAFGAPSGSPSVSTNSGTITFPTATANWGTIVAVGIFDAVSAGNLLFYGNLTANQTINTGGVFSFSAADVSITVD